MIRSTLKLSEPKKSRKNFNIKNCKILSNEEEIKQFKSKLCQHIVKIETSKETDTIQESYDKILNALNLSLQQTHSTNYDSKPKKISERTIALIKRRQVIQRTKFKTRSMKNELKALYKLISKHIRQDYIEYRKNILQRHLETTGSIKKARKELQTHSTWIDGLDNLGKTALNRNEILNIATEFYKNLYDRPRLPDISHQTDDEYVNNSTDIKPIDESEILTIIKNLKCDKSPGPDGITNEVLKHGGSILSKSLSSLFNRILHTATIPSQWSHSNIILIYKKGNPRNISNYRPISLLPSLYKLFASIIQKRIRMTVEKQQPVEQAGFRKGYSTVDHIHTLELILEKYQEQQRHLYIAFVDYQKAFDSLTHPSIWQALMVQKIEPQYISVIKNIYGNCTCRITLESKGPEIAVKRGVRQGDPLSPTLFISVLENVFRHLDWDRCGIIVKGTHFNHLRFADDIVLVSESCKELQYMITTLHSASTQVGLNMNPSKTKIMTNTRQIPINVNNVPLEYVKEYIYLGKQVSFKTNNNLLEVERRVKHTWNKYWNLKEVFKSDLPIALKKKVMDSNLLPCLTYACQTWKFTNTVKNKITICQRGIERSMLNIKKQHRVRHSIIRSKTKAIDALTHAQKQKWKWAGHIARLKDNRWTKKITSWNGPFGKRKRGRQYTRWEDEIVRIAGPHWLDVALDRERWHNLEEAFTSGVLKKIT
ncbi:unnamed protein product [Euphydryas editha]|uniref:Reverse transcriptase domain-containing protein n=1 Tax=Euphydryas editha TaxID=104508 RepID=A0AAU9V0L5_EUPED|nr:unnamed protein product [Euphydryas editha]